MLYTPKLPTICCTSYYYTGVGNNMQQERMGKHYLKLVLLWLSLLVLAQNASAVAAAMEQDDKGCADEMQGLATCIAYVSGASARPSPECCAGAEKVRSQEPRCLCLLILRSTNASQDLPINTTLALAMPAACRSDADVSECPRILKLEPGSPEAKIFENSTSSAAPSSSPPSDPATKGAPTSCSGRLALLGTISLILTIVHLAIFLTVIV